MSDLDGEQADIADAASTDEAEASTIVAKVSTARGNKGVRQPNYTPIEDEMCAKAFVHASENSIHGAKQKGALFEAEIGKAYENLRLEQVNLDQLLYQQAKTTFIRAAQLSGSDLNYPKKMSNPYPQRNDGAILQRFRKYIAPTVMKFYSIRDQFPKESGEDDDRWYARLDNIFFQRYGKMFDLRAVALYLQDKPKWLAYAASISNERKSPKRPAGKKLTLKQQQDKKKEEEENQVVETIVNDVAGNISVALGGATHHSQSRDQFYNTISGVLSQVAVYLEDSTLDEEARAVVQQERSRIRILELKAKRRRLEAQAAHEPHGGEVVVVETNDVGAADDVGATDDVLTQYSL